MNKLKKDIITFIKQARETAEFSLNNNQNYDPILNKIDINTIKACNDGIGKVERITKNNIKNYLTVFKNKEVIYQAFTYSSKMLNNDLTLNIPFILENCKKENYNLIFTDTFINQLKQIEMKNNIELTLDFLGSLKIDNLDVLDFIDESDINSELTFDDLTNILDNNNAFDVDIIYYSNAIKYLSENDNSLHRSLNLAAELCIEPGDLSSEILASLLASDQLRNDWSDLEAEITDFLNNLEW